MKRTLQIGLVIVSLCGLVSPASAGDGKKSQWKKYVGNATSGVPQQLGSQQRKLDFFRKSPPDQQTGKKLESWKTNGDNFSVNNGNSNNNNPHGKKHQDSNNPPNPITLGPQQGDGRVQVDPVPITPMQPQGPAGYVFVNGHWERAKANGTSVSSPDAPAATVQVRDHRPIDPNGRGRDPGYFPQAPKDPRDVSNSSGGVKVTDSPPRDLTGQTVYGEGPGLHTLWDILPPYGFTAQPSKTTDHRDPSKR